MTRKRIHVNIATDPDYWGGEPSAADLTRLDALVGKVAAEYGYDHASVEHVPETLSRPNQNSGEAEDILEKAWQRFCQQ